MSAALRCVGIDLPIELAVAADCTGLVLAIRYHDETSRGFGAQPDGRGRPCTQLSYLAHTAMARTISVSRLVAALVILGIAISSALAVIANWQLRHWLRSQAAAMGCSFEFASATADFPSTFRLRSAQLTACNQGLWSARVAHATGKVSLRSLIWGPFQLEQLGVELESLHVGGVALDGTVQVIVARRARAVHAKVWASELSLRRGAQQLATSARTSLDLEIPVGSDASPSFAQFAVQSLTSTPIALEAEGPVMGSAQISWHERTHRLELQEGRVGSVPVRLRGGSFRATLQSFYVSASGDATSARAGLLLEGPNAHVLLEALKAPESLSFALSALENAPFTFSSSVGYASGKWTFEDIALDTDGASVTGVASLHGSNRSGKLRLVYGGVAMGVQFSNERSNVFFNPATDWLRSGM